MYFNHFTLKKHSPRLDSLTVDSGVAKLIKQMNNGFAHDMLLFKTTIYLESLNENI